MKSLYLGLICLLFMSSCKSDKEKTTENLKVKQELTVAEKIANAHGFEHWKNVSEVKFTFQVDKDSIKGIGRKWTWFPKQNRVLLTDNDQNYDYYRHEVDSTNMVADKAFINDKFWLLIPFQLVWDSSAKITEPKTATTPISKDVLQMITLTYSNEGGYTPGDAYDIFYDNDFIIKEWIFRRGNSAEPSLTTTFENIKDFNGIKIAIDHKQESGHWNLNFTDVNIVLDTKE
ncbi:hypothetical protein [Winogradskyella vidalii]|uniref:hypothetical protein n=1 Tax=Winogradskyella vidalii TaxID=2615024 RepID=UPI0015C82D0B|nr:hypothetical protein [Winogradskyella vidalii]